MKKMTRILSAALVAMMVLSLAAIASAETPSVYIPGRLAKLVDAAMEDYVFPELVTKGDTKVVDGKIKLNTEGVMHFQFTEKPDWFGASVSSRDGGWIQIDIDDSGYGELDLEGLHRQPGMYSWYNSKVTYWDKYCNLRFRDDWTEGDWEGAKTFKKDELVPADKYGWLYGNGGDYPYVGGKDYGDYSVTVNYQRDGFPSEVAVTLKNTDLFETGIEGAATTITFSMVNVELDSYAALKEVIAEVDDQGKVTNVDNWFKPNNKWIKVNRDKKTGKVVSVTYMDEDYAYDRDINKTEAILANMDIWYVSSVSATYPEGNYIVGVEADYRNDAKNNLHQYKISYAPSENEVYQIYYRTWDSPFYGLYSKNGTVTAVSGSGNNLNKWYKYNGSTVNATVLKRVLNEDGKTYSYVEVTEKKLNNNGKQVKTIKKGINSFPSPRVTVK